MKTPSPSKPVRRRQKTGNIAASRTKYADLGSMRVDDVAERVDPNKPLTALQRRFVEQWAAGETIPNAALRAGYNDTSHVYKIARMPQAIALYEKEKAKYEAACDMTRKKVMDGFVESIELAKLMAEPATMVAGWREIARLCGYHEPIKRTLDINVTGNVVLERLNKLSDAELLKLIQAEVTPALIEMENDDGEPE